MRRLLLVLVLVITSACTVETYEDGSARIIVNDSVTIVLHSDR